jgi:glycosyltransferase involved in cell wall biosynthesis
MTSPRTLMLVSAPADETFRARVRDGLRPCPEYLRLEEKGVELLDWSRLDPPLRRRTWLGSVRHARAAMRRLDGFDVVFSDGEPVGVPLALEMMRRGIAMPHLVLGHRLTARHKAPFFSVLKSHRAMSRILVHSTRQLESVPGKLGIPASKVAFIPYFADGSFWRPRPGAEERLVVSAGREHRDYETLTAACASLDASVFIADGSVHTPGARRRGPTVGLSNIRTGFADFVQLRDAYARAAVVAVPLVENDFQAGVTTLLEAMAMGKAIVVTSTYGQKDVIEDGVTGVTVPPGRPAPLREAIEMLLASPGERRRLGDNARAAFEAEFALDEYVERLLQHLQEIKDESDAVRPAVALRQAAG